MECEFKYRLSNVNGKFSCSPCGFGCVNCIGNPSLCAFCDEKANYVRDDASK